MSRGREERRKESVGERGGGERKTERGEGERGGEVAYSQ